MNLEERLKENLKKYGKIQVRPITPPRRWLGKWTDELSDLFEEHHKLFGIYPDELEDIELNDYSYDEVIKMLKFCSKNNVDIDDYTTYLVLEQMHRDVEEENRHGKR